MITFTPHASGSAANAYSVSDGKSTLLLDCGLRWKALQEALDFKVTGLAGCLLSHGHGDHSKSAKAVMKAGVDLFLTKPTADALGLSGHRLKVVKPLELFRVGTWKVIAFDTVHDAEGSVGYLIESEEGQRLLFATDTMYLANRFQGLNVIALECNYSLDLIRENVETGAIDPALKNRVMRSHMSLQSVIEMLKANDLSAVSEVWLLHLSSSNSDAERFKKEVQKACGKPTYIA